MGWPYIRITPSGVADAFGAVGTIVFNPGGTVGNMNTGLQLGAAAANWALLANKNAYTVAAAIAANELAMGSAMVALAADAAFANTETDPLRRAQAQLAVAGDVVSIVGNASSVVGAIASFAGPNSVAIGAESIGTAMTVLGISLGAGSSPYATALFASMRDTSTQQVSDWSARRAELGSLFNDDGASVLGAWTTTDVHLGAANTAAAAVLGSFGTAQFSDNVAGMLNAFNTVGQSFSSLASSSGVTFSPIQETIGGGTVSVGTPADMAAFGTGGFSFGSDGLSVNATNTVVSPAHELSGSSSTRYVR